MLLHDAFGRKISYLRLSLISKCNFRCFYCQPYETHSNKGQNKTQTQIQSHPLSIVEIKNLTKALGLLGVKKIRLTGGEPTLRPDIVQIVQMLLGMGLFEKVALSTNGIHLKRLAPKLKAAGLHALNISLDTLDQKNFMAITGSDKLREVLLGIEAALIAGIETIKVNAVLMNGLNTKDIDLFLELIKSSPISVRFIEFMKTETNLHKFTKYHISNEVIKSKFKNEGWKSKSSLASLAQDGPAEVYTHPDFVGTLGFISPYSRKFCGECNRMRVDSRGRVRMCLFGKTDYDIRPLLQREEMIPELQETILQLMDVKPKQHHLEKGDFGTTQNLLSIGG